jgi:F420-non-reducing hydrogenase iron-sulfur subunit
MKTDPNVRVIRVMCSGRVDEKLVLKAFALGADGVLVSGCHPGDCHYQRGNLHARRRAAGLKSFLEVVGIGRDRLRLEWISASEGPKVVETVNDFTQTIKQLGPSPFNRRRNEH